MIIAPRLFQRKGNAGKLSCQMSMDEQTAPRAAANAAASAKTRRYLIGRYHEIVLKGGNRWRFVEQLKRNVRAVFADCGCGRIRSEGPRLMIEIPAAVPDALVHERAALLFGLQNFTISRPVPLEVEAITREAVAAARNARAGCTRWRAFGLGERHVTDFIAPGVRHAGAWPGRSSAAAGAGLCHLRLHAQRRWRHGLRRR